jgi:chemotaxis-related protein WspB
MNREAGPAAFPAWGTMLLLTFRAAESPYAVDVARVVEVVPRIDVRRLPHAPAFLAGVFDYRGMVVPVIDLGILLGSGACPYRLSTRIILVDLRPADRGGPTLAGEADGPGSVGPGRGSAPDGEAAHDDRHRLLGLVAEQVSDVSTVRPDQVISAAMQLPQSPYLGAIVAIGREMVQLIEPDRILDASLRSAFFGERVDVDPAAGPPASPRVGAG